MSCEYDTDLMFMAKEIIDPCDKTALHAEVEKRIDLDSIIQALPGKKQQVANLFREGISQSEIAKTLNLSRGRISQILREIGKLIKEQE